MFSHGLASTSLGSISVFAIVVGGSVHPEAWVGHGAANDLLGERNAGYDGDCVHESGPVRSCCFG